jgi:Amt family ammonium transporter
VLGYGGAGLAEGVTVGGQFTVQLMGVAAAVVWSAVATFVIVLIVRATIGLRAGTEAETDGLDFAHHGETAYRL